MRVTHRRRRRATTSLVLVMTAALVASCTSSEAEPQAGGNGPVIGAPDAPKPSTTLPKPPVPSDREPVSLTTYAGRQSPGVIAAGGGDAPYNYAPSVLLDNGRYRMWWCSQLGVANPPGDDILLAESTSMDGPFAGPDGRGGTPVFSGSGTQFDGMHTCDPSVVKVGGTYFMYYTGAAGAHAHGNAIGLATSTDGRVWTRANGGRPLITVSRNVRRDNTYGVGQPSVVYLAGRYYLMFTDTTGQDAGRNGAGQFVLRSTDPAFTREVEALGPTGFRPVPDTNARVPFGRRRVQRGLDVGRRARRFRHRPRDPRRHHDHLLGLGFPLPALTSRAGAGARGRGPRPGPQGPTDTRWSRSTTRAAGSRSTWCGPAARRRPGPLTCDASA